MIRKKGRLSVGSGRRPWSHLDLVTPIPILMESVREVDSGCWPVYYEMGRDVEGSKVWDVAYRCTRRLAVPSL